MYLEINEVAPISHPLIEQRTFIGLHRLKTALEFLITQLALRLFRVGVH